MNKLCKERCPHLDPSSQSQQTPAWWNRCPCCSSERYRCRWWCQCSQRGSLTQSGEQCKHHQWPVLTCVLDVCGVLSDCSATSSFSKHLDVQELMIFTWEWTACQSSKCMNHSGMMLLNICILNPDHLMTQHTPKPWAHLPSEKLLVSPLHSSAL